MGKRTWTEDEVKLLEDCCSKYLSIKETSNILNKTETSVIHKISRMGFSNKYIKKNNANYKSIYQDYDWCYDCFINKSMTMEEMADIANTTVRTIKKWCSEIHRLNTHTFKNYKSLNELQYQLVSIGTIGDGHIDKREDQPMYIESHAFDEKEYLYWKYDILKDLCSKEPKEITVKDRIANDKVYKCQLQYRFNTRCILELNDIVNKPKIDIINNINEFQFSLLLLDDGSRDNLWELCVANWKPNEVDAFIDKCLDFNIKAIKLEDSRYILFDAISSKKIDNIILNNIPNELDIIKKKIINNNKIKPLQDIFYVFIDNNTKLGLKRYCNLRHYSYSKIKPFTKTLDLKFNEIEEKDLISLLGKEKIMYEIQ